MRIFALLSLLFIIFSVPALAEEFKVQPEHCEFSITFPEQPFSSERCSRDDVNQCAAMKNFTRIYETGQSVNFRTHCEVSSLAAYQSYTEKTTKTVLKAIAKKNNANTINTTYREDESESYKVAGLIAEGMRGRKGMVYLAQLWIGKNSVMTIESELVGEELEVADTLFRDILQSVGYAAPETTEDVTESPQEE